MVKDGKKVTFKHYKLGELWYVTEDGFEFPVPIDDAGDGTFLAEDKALLFMRYIRKHMEMIAAAKQEQNKPCCGRCKHSSASHTVDGPCDVGGCTQCDCREFHQPVVPDVPGSEFVSAYEPEIL